MEVVDAGNNTEPTLRQLMKAIHLCQASLTKQFDKVRVAVSLVKRNMQKLWHHMGNVEQNW